MGDILPNILSNVTQAYGSPYSALIGSFFNIITGTDYKHDDVADSQEEGSEDQTEDVYYSGDATENYSQDQEYSEGQPQQGQEHYDVQPEQGQEYNQNQTQPASQEEYSQPVYGSERQPLEVSIDFVKEIFINGRYQAVPIRDGDTLNQRDNYKILFQSSTPCYMYIAQLDATGKMDPILPSRFTSYRNPIRPDVLHDIPSGTNWFYLDANRGVETIYFIASRTPRQDIEQLFRKLEMTNRTLIQHNTVSMDSAYVVTRGIGGMRPAGNQIVNFQNGRQGQYAATLLQSIQADFVMTRWFHHR